MYSEFLINCNREVLKISWFWEYNKYDIFVWFYLLFFYEMKKIFWFLIFGFMCALLAWCGNKKVDETNYDDVNIEEQKESEIAPVEDEIVDETQIDDDEIIDFYDDEYFDDEIIEWDDEDNKPYEEEEVVVDEIVNCDGCVFAYFNDEGDKAKSLGSALSEGEYTTDIATLKTNGGKQRHNFFGLVLSEGKISRAYSCIRKNNKIYCIEGSTDGAYHSNNIGILNQIFTADQCKYISDGHTYTCTDGDYNGDTQSHGYTSLHYETSCTIYGADARAGTLICH